MKLNEPNTGFEKTFGEHVELISTTDLKGRITSCNEAFQEVAGFTCDELMGQSHNIVRNPDVPPELFADMWATLKSGRPWMGVVKNRCKNGDHYWVDAYVTPIIQNNAVVGYESVRRAATRAQIAAAEAIYERVRSGAKFKPVGDSRSRALMLTAVVPPLTVAGAAMLGSSAAVLVGLSVLSAAAAGAASWWVTRPLRSMAAAARSQINNPILQKLYSDDASELGSIVLQHKMEQARQNTMLGRSHYAATQINLHASKTSDIARNAHDGVNQQRLETETIASAMEEMSASVAGVANSAQQASEVASTIDAGADKGREALSLAEQTVLSIDASVTDAATAMESLSKDAESIGTVTEVIQTIAEQTNLLALNAAIEAARAGEQGRGFAVVADEVRMLASRTAESTLEIRNIVETLQNRTRDMVVTMEKGRTQAHQGVQNTQRVKEELEGILDGVGQIKAMNLGISTAAQEQSAVSHEISANIHNISNLAHQTSEIANEAMEESKSLDDLASELEDLVERFRA